MGQPGRGSVWEESVITSPSQIQMVALSATLPNAYELAKWIQDVTNQTVTLIEVPTSKRPVPLRYLYATKDGLFPLFRDKDAGPGSPKGLLGYRGDDGAGSTAAAAAESTSTTTANKSNNKKGFSGGGGGKEGKKKDKIPRGLQVNPALKAAFDKRMHRVNRAIERNRVQQRQQQSRGGGSRYNNVFDDDDDNGDWQSRQRRRSKPAPSYSGRRLSPREERKERDRLLKKEMRRAVPSLSAIVQRLQAKDLLPAIFFIFSRAGCDEAARTLYRQRKGPRHDPNRLLPQELEEFQQRLEEEEEEEQQEKSPKRKTRKRGKRWGSKDFVEDKDGRTFRSTSNYISEDLLQSMYDEPDDSLDEDDFEEYSSSPLSSDNWDFYSRAGLLNYKQVKEVAARIQKFNRDNPEIAFDDEIIEQYLFGVGSHHAGMLPAHKSFIEILYRKQLMKVVFATETLAAGINMVRLIQMLCFIYLSICTKQISYFLVCFLTVLFVARADDSCVLISETYWNWC